jgi:hypothetical protein
MQALKRGKDERRTHSRRLRMDKDCHLLESLACSCDDELSEASSNKALREAIMVLQVLSNGWASFRERVLMAWIDASLRDSAGSRST